MFPWPIFTLTIFNNHVGLKETRFAKKGGWGRERKTKDYITSKSWDRFLFILKSGVEVMPQDESTNTLMQHEW